jgi:hypothetical protein
MVALGDDGRVLGAALRPVPRDRHEAMAYAMEFSWPTLAAQYARILVSVNAVDISSINKAFSGTYRETAAFAHTAPSKRRL